MISNKGSANYGSSGVNILSKNSVQEYIEKVPNCRSKLLHSTKSKYLTDRLTKNSFSINGLSEHSSTKHVLKSESVKAYDSGSSSLSSTSKVESTVKHEGSKKISVCKIGELRENSRKSTFTNHFDTKQNNEEVSSASSFSMGCNSFHSTKNKYLTDPLIKNSVAINGLSEHSSTKHAFENETIRIHDSGSSSSSSTSQIKKTVKHGGSKKILVCKIGDLRENSRKSTFANQFDTKQSNEEVSSASSFSKGCNLLNSTKSKELTDSLIKSRVAVNGSSEHSSTKNAFESESIRMHDNGSSSSSSTSQVKKTEKHEGSKKISVCKIGDLRKSTSSFSTGCNSSGSFLSNDSQRVKSNSLRDGITEFSKALRLFDKSGKPLTDRMGRPLYNILGECLVVFDNCGKAISDSNGNQVFNSLGESAIYATTNLYIAPSDEEPRTLLLDVHNTDIMFLFDNKGRPLTDGLGRPLLSASGNLMIGMKSDAKINVSDYASYKLKNLYGKASLENSIRHVQIFDSDRKPLSDDCGRLLEGATVVCNKNGMPICDCKGGNVHFKYGRRISTCENTNEKVDKEKGTKKAELGTCLTSDVYQGGQNFKDKVDQQQFIHKEKLNDIMTSSERCISDGLIKYSENSTQNSTAVNSDTSDDYLTCKTKPSLMTDGDKAMNVQDEEHNEDVTEECKTNNSCNDEISDVLKEGDMMIFSRGSRDSQDCILKQHEVYPSVNNITNLPENKTTFLLNNKTKHKTSLSAETVFLFNATEKMENKEKSLINIAHFEAVKGMKIKNQRDMPNKMNSFNPFQLFKDVFAKSNENHGVGQYQYNEYGKPLKDIYGNSLYDKYGIPLTGAQGKRLSEESRRTLRLKLRNVPKNKTNITNEGIFLPVANNESHNQFGEPFYDKYGRPLYELSGRLIYDRFGRPLTDAFGRPLVDAIGQPLMDCDGAVLTSACESESNMKLTDIFGRKIYDRRGRMLFDSYGRPKYDIFSNAIYDSCGRPATDANGKILFDFLNKPIQPYPEKPLYKSARAHLPRYIDTILAVPGMYRVLKYSQPLEDVFGGPLFDDLGRPLYNKIGKPLYDRYGRPLYNKKGSPLCDCYGRPLSEDIKQNDDDLTLSVVDCLKLLKITEEYSKWMIGRNKRVKSKRADLKKNITLKISYKNKTDKKRSGQYVYTLTRVTRFVSGRQALEILEAPLSPATISEMHRLPVDNKPLVMVVGQRHKQTVKQQ